MAIVVDSPEVTIRTLSSEQQALLNAADLLEREGWTPSAFHDAATGRRCAMGALVRVVLGRDYHVGLQLGGGPDDSVGHLVAEAVTPHARLILQALGITDFWKSACERVIDWNDCDAPSGAAVIRAMREAALL